MKQKTKILFTTFSVLAVFAGLMIAYATSPTWTQDINYTYTSPTPSPTPEPNPSFTVNGTTTSTTSLTIPALVNENSIYNVKYTVVNNGNVPITVTAQASTTTCTAVWNSAPTLLMQPGDSAVFALTLTEFTGTGTCTVAFSKA